jgi:MFS family permease
MLGLFLVLPVFALHARQLPGGDNALMVGLAFGIYGLTQACLQIPFGAASDRLGRKPVMVAGLLLFALGSVVAALADTVLGLLLGRALQGAGAISAVVTATLADATRDSQRTKAMAVIGGSIALTFALSLVISPVLYGKIGLSGLFWVIAALALLGIVVVWKGLAPEERDQLTDSGKSWTIRKLLTEPNLIRLNLGVFSLHLVQMAMFAVVPLWLLNKAGLPAAEHWKLYLPTLLGSLVIMAPLLMRAERMGKNRQLFVGAIVLLALVQLGFAAVGSGWFSSNGLVPMAILLLLFFLGFNILEASLPSLVSRLAPAESKGAALGIYNTTQALGLFVGPALAGGLQKWYGEAAVFLSCAAVLLLWSMVAPGLTRWPGRSNKQEREQDNGISQ